MKRKASAEREKLSIERLKKFNGCEQFTDKQAQEILNSIEVLSLIIGKQILNDLNK